MPSEPGLVALFLAFAASPAQESGNRAALGPPRFPPTLPTRQNVRSCKSNRIQWRNSLLYSPHLMPWNPEMRRIEQTHGKTSAIRWPFDGHSLLTPFARLLIRIKSTKGTEQTNPPMRYSNTLRTATSSTGQPMRTSAITSKTPQSRSRGLRKTADSNKRHTRCSADSTNGIHGALRIQQTAYGALRTQTNGMHGTRRLPQLPWRKVAWPNAHPYGR